MSKLWIQNGLIVNPPGAPLQGKLDLLIEDGVITRIAPEIPAADVADAQVIDANNCHVMPGFVDMHTHLREPGQEYKEDIASGTLAAVHGGFTAVCCMPNTAPTIDDPALVRFVHERAREADNCKVHPIASITKGLKGEELSEMGLLLQAGAVAFSDDGKPIADPQRMRLAAQYARNFDALLMLHCEDRALAANGVMHEGYYSATLGLAGIPAASESAMVARDILIAESYGARIHICHVSTEQSVALIRAAKERGVRVTCETAPHYFTATDEWVDLSGYDSNTKMNPPLRSASDRAAIIEALVDGTIDAIATDHAPHHLDEKRVEFNNALFGIVGLETAYSLAITQLVKPGHLTPEQLVARMSAAPCHILGLPGGELKEGVAADITIANPDNDIVYTTESLHSKSKNSPFLERPLFGRVMQTIVDGKTTL